jgi:hypothetical protein
MRRGQLEHARLYTCFILQQAELSLNYFLSFPYPDIYRNCPRIIISLSISKPSCSHAFHYIRPHNCLRARFRFRLHHLRNLFSTMSFFSPKYNSSSINESAIPNPAPSPEQRLKRRRALGSRPIPLDLAERRKSHPFLPADEAIVLRDAWGFGFRFGSPPPPRLTTTLVSKFSNGRCVVSLTIPRRSHSSHLLLTAFSKVRLAGQHTNLRLGDSGFCWIVGCYLARFSRRRKKRT